MGEIRREKAKLKRRKIEATKVENFKSCGALVIDGNSLNKMETGIDN